MTKRKPAAALARLALAAFCVLIFVAPYFQGLYFEKQRFVAEIVVFVLAFLWLASSSSRRSPAGLPVSVLPRGVLGLGAMAVPVAYLLATPFAASPRSAIGETLTAAMTLAVMWVVSEACMEEGDLDLPLKAIGASGVIIALIGMGTATKLLSYPSAWEAGRLYSTLQYPNTAASALMAALFCCGAQWAKAAGRAGSGIRAGVRAIPLPAWLETALWGCAGALTTAGFILTLSRGALVVLPFAAVLFIVGSPWRVKPAAICYLAVSLLSGIPAAGRFTAALNPLDVKRAWTWICGASVGAALILLAGVAGVALVRMLRAKSPSPEDILARGGSPEGGSLRGQAPSPASAREPRVSRAMVGVIVVVGLIIVVLCGAVLLTRYSSSGPMARLRAMALSESSLQERIIWPLDAVRIALRRPLTGFGGGGWAMVYSKYRQYPYYTKLVHNHFAQVLVDTGLIGFAVFLLFCFGLAKSAWDVVHDPETGEGLKTTVWGAATSAVALLAHGAIDFNLSLPAVAVFLWALAGVVHGGSRGAASWRATVRVDSAFTGAIGRKVPAGIFAVCAALTVCLALSGWFAARGNAAWREQRYDDAVSLMQRAAALDPFSSAVRAGLGQYCRLLAEARRDKDLMQRAVNSFTSAVQLSPYDSVMRLDYAALLSRVGQMGPAIRNAQSAVDNNPFLSLGYEVLTGLYVENGKRLALAGKVEEARASIAAGLAVKETLDKKNAGIPQQYRRFVTADRALKVTPMMLVYRAQARFFLGEREAVAQELKPVLAAGAGKDANTKAAYANAVLWDGLAIGATGDHATAGKRMKEAIDMAPEIQPEAPRARDVSEKLGLGYKL
ncbi:MAG: O-antigen ligase family protein [Bacillota bacterium]